MSWTDERIARLVALWNDGLTASQIAKVLGGISRNGVIGKAHRIGLKSRPSPVKNLEDYLLGKVDDLPLSRRTQKLLWHDNIIYIGDLVQRTEPELLRIAMLGPKSVSEIKEALSSFGLRLGMWFADWPPESLSQTENEFAKRVSELKQASGGATFVHAGDYLVMQYASNSDDLAAAMIPMNMQMQAVLGKMAKDFIEAARRVDNQPGWRGFSSCISTIAKLLSMSSEEIPENLGYLYSCALELGSFYEMDQQLLEHRDANSIPLDPELRRPLSNLIRGFAPWLRAFPSARLADDEAGRFLVQAAELEPAYEVVSSARQHKILRDTDIDVLKRLMDASDRGEFQGQKAGGCVKRQVGA